MLNIVERNDEDLVTLKHGGNVFHDALKLVLDGETRIHVTDEEGKIPDYDLEYTENMMLFNEIARKQIYMMTKGAAIISTFLSYDENDIDNLCMEFLQQFDKAEIEVADEYSIVIAKIILKHTDIIINYTDERFEWFIEPSKRFVKVDSLPAEKEKSTLRITASVYDIGYTTRDFSRLGSVIAFQNIFFWQDFMEGKKGPFKYVEVALTQIAGIGGILSNVSMIDNAVAPKGYMAYLKPDCTRYSQELLSRYFKINPKPEDATEDNTIFIHELSIFVTTWYGCQFPANFDESIFNEKFASDLKHYADAIIGGKKVLGVLARGTDYITSKLGNDRKHATAEQMITVIQKWMDEDGYDKIFLATEDDDILKKIRAAFPKKIIAISQKRTSVKELKKAGAVLLNDYEAKKRSGQALKDALEDTTVNYFYALYMLARCDSFLCSGQCNGWYTVRSLKKGKFNRERKLFVAREGDPVTEKWKMVRPITAGMFARGVYPTDKAFYMTYRFDLSDAVNADAISKAWDKTLSVYPYMGYGVGIREGELVLIENPLPFIIEETSEVIEPYGRSGNFHTVTFCYLDNVLWIYADNVPLDGTGFKAVLETFFYHYYSIIDGKKYEVPDGVYTEGVVEGQDVDAYLKVDAADPTAMAQGFGDNAIFTPIEGVREELFLTREDCRGYCISAPSDEFMSYAKSVGASPMSMLNVFFARAMERVHPENELPIRVISPISVRKAMGNETSLLHQVVHAPYTFQVEDLKKDDATLNKAYRAFLKGFASEQNIKNMCGIYRGICEGYKKAYASGALDNVILEQRSKGSLNSAVSHLGTLRTASYGNRIKMSAFHAMQEKGIMLQVTEVGDYFYINWYQGFHGDMYAKAMRDIMKEAGMKSTRLERVE